LHDVTQEKELEKMKLDFVSMATHELRTPLTSIKGYLSFLNESAMPKLTDDEQKFLKNIATSADTLGVLIDNILSLSRIEQGAMKLSLAPVNLVLLLKKTVEQMQVMAAKKDLVIQFHADQNIPDLSVDQMRMSEVMTNLLDNAIKFTPQAGHIQVSIERKDHLVQICIADSGIGIPQSAIKHLFTKFYRVTGPLEQGTKGTGLGLYISKVIIQMHHGSIWVESQENVGSKFYFTIPLKPLESDTQTG
jgi:signal transduction histidine kinase